MTTELTDIARRELISADPLPSWIPFLQGFYAYHAQVGFPPYPDGHQRNEWMAGEAYAEKLQGECDERVKAMWRNTMEALKDGV